MKTLNDKFLRDFCVIFQLVAVIQGMKGDCFVEFLSYFKAFKPQPPVPSTPPLEQHTF